VEVGAGGAETVMVETAGTGSARVRKGRVRARRAVGRSGCILGLCSVVRAGWMRC